MKRTDDCDLQKPYTLHAGTRTCVQMFRREMPSTGDAIYVANYCKNEQSIHLVKAEDLPHTEVCDGELSTYT